MKTIVRQTGTHQLNHEIPALFGREHDLETVTAMLQTPDCRLVTLSGPGGIGKTSLAQRIARHMLADFENHVHFIPLQSVTSAHYLPATILEALGCRLYGTEDPTAQLLHYLVDKRMLLALDNFEHLIESGDIISLILERAPHISLLITSRAVLNLHQEWVWPVRGIGFPPAVDTPDAVQYAAIRMFDARAKRINPAFSLQQELPAVTRICALVEGNPLAIELATVWLRSLTCHDILNELRQDIDILSTSMRDIPEQHRSIRAVFDRSWQQLTTAEQQTLMQLSLFHGSFSWDAARSIAQISLNMLSALIDKSLLYHNQHGRYTFHELFRQYVHNHLIADAETFNRADTAFTDYYRQFLAQRFDDVWGPRQREAIREVTDELHNVRRVLDRLTQTDDTATGRRCAYTLAEIFQLVGYYREGADFTSAIVDQLEQLNPQQRDVEQQHLLAEMLNALAWLCIRLGEFDRAQAAITRAQAIYDSHGLVPATGFATDPRAAMGELQSILGNLQAAQAYAEPAYRDALSRDDSLNRTTALYVLTAVSLQLGDYEQAEKYVTEAIDLNRHTGNDWFLAYCLNQHGHICRERGDYESAHQHYEESYRIRQTFRDPEGQAVALLHLSSLALLQNQYPQAIEMLRNCISVYQHLEDRGGLFTAHYGLAIAFTASENHHEAHQHLISAVHIAEEVQVSSWWLSVSQAAGEFFFATGAHERGMQLVLLALNHPETTSVTRTRADRWLQHNRPTHTDHAPIDVNAVARQLGRELVLYSWAAAPPTPQPETQSHLIEPLSDRELEILRLLADGLTNQEIAQRLVLALGTIKTHNYNIFSKLGVKNRGQAVRRARELNLL